MVNHKDNKKENTYNHYSEEIINIAEYNKKTDSENKERKRSSPNSNEKIKTKKSSKNKQVSSKNRKSKTRNSSNPKEGTSSDKSKTKTYIKKRSATLIRPFRNLLRKLTGSKR